MAYLFTSESVSEGHPDKISDQISDALLDAFLAGDPKSRVACETFCTTGLVVVGGEVTTETYVDIPAVVRDTIRRIGYTDPTLRFDADSCGVLNAIHEQSPDINRGVDRAEGEQGAGDQGMMFGYATNETDNYMPLALDISHKILQVLADIRREPTGGMDYLRPDAKSQVTIEYSDDNVPQRITTVVVSTQHDEFGDDDAKMLARIKEDVKSHLMPKVKALYPSHAHLFEGDIIYHVNPTGKFVIGGPHGDAGLTGRKIIVDTYGGKGAHGGGAFSGKDSSKVDRSAAYATRHVAKNLVAAGLCDQVLVQVAYAIGVAAPVGVFVDTYGTCKKEITDGEIAEKVTQIFDLKPAAIIERFGLTNPIFSTTAAYGHFGREVGTVEVNGTRHETFTWEKLDRVDDVKGVFGLS